VSVFHIGTGKVDGSGVVIGKPVPAAVNLELQPNYRMVIEVQGSWTCCFVPTGKNMLAVLLDKSGISRPHEYLCCCRETVIVYNRQTTGGVGCATTARTFGFFLHEKLLVEKIN